MRERKFRVSLDLDDEEIFLFSLITGIGLGKWTSINSSKESINRAASLSIKITTAMGNAVEVHYSPPDPPPDPPQHIDPGIKGA